VAVPSAPVCRTCGAPAAPDQEYCLECGNRLVPARRAPSLAAWIVPSLVALLVAAGGAAAAIAATHATTKSTRALVALSPLRPAPPPPAPAAKAKAKPARPKGKQAQGLISWPSGNGYTIVLATLPLTQGAAAPHAQALRALRHHLPQVGILVSSSYPSLQPGYYIVFSGIFASLEEAQSSLDAAKAFFPSAYARPIAR
jgi:hypothetical protein